MTLPIGAVAPGAAAAAEAPARSGLSKQDAEGFERLLLAQLSKTLVESATAKEGASGAVTGVYADMLPEALTQALMDGGGIGLAKTIEGAS